MPYDPLDLPKPVAPDIWVVDGPEISFLHLPFPTRMTVIRLRDGSLWVHSPIRLNAAVREAVTALGPVAHLVAPNWIHYAALGDWATAFPEATVWAAPGVAERAASHGTTPRIDHLLEPGTATPWEPEIAWMLVEGSEVHREAVFFHAASRTLILTDLIENFERAKVAWWVWPLLRLAGNRDPDGKMPRDMAWTFRKGRKRLRAAVEQMIGWGPERVILAHGRWYETNGVAELRRAFRDLLR
ncbi:DUF4336 domain-containing protein [Tropicimonas sp. IMCC34043]|uniref:DUF4336 domain-containing protein n=1 Tax=Tropicimonas sp. IMCC34043 TaxID=2248760 RepID=UPI000E247FBF|nr:DUF4336 domain-containing protein [Tropicimonas sp. IMCC34043]